MLTKRDYTNLSNFTLIFLVFNIMNKKIFLNAILCGAMLMPAGAVLVSCGDDNDDLKSQIAVLQTAVEDLKEQLGNALTTGASITNAEQDETGKWTLTLSNGSQIVIGSSLTGGADALRSVLWCTAPKRLTVRFSWATMA